LKVIVDFKETWLILTADPFCSGECLSPNIVGSISILGSFFSSKPAASAVSQIFD